MSKQYDEFKKQTIEATDVVSKAHNMRALSDDFVDGFAKAMWEAREIFMRVEDDFAPTTDTTLLEGVDNG